MFPDAAPLHVSRILTAIERAGLEPTHVEGFRMDYARTLQEWTRNLEANWDRAHGAGRSRADADLAPLPTGRAARL